MSICRGINTVHTDINIPQGSRNIFIVKRDLQLNLMSILSESYVFQSRRYFFPVCNKLGKYKNSDYYA